MITIFQKTAKGRALKTLDAVKPGVWINVENPDPAEINRLAVDCSLQKELLTDALDAHEVPRIEREGGAVYIYTRVPYRDKENRIITLPLLIAVGEAAVLTVSLRKLPFLEKFTNGSVPISTTQKTKLLFLIFFEITALYNNFLTAITRQVRRIDIHPERVENEHIVQFVMYENTLNDFLSALVPMRTTLQSILLGKFLPLYEEDRDLVEDLRQDTEQLIEMGKSVLKSIVNVRTAHTALMTNDLNRVMKRLTALTVILTVPTMIASFYGMNTPLPFANSNLTFAAIGLVTLGLVSAIIVVFSQKRWL